MPRRILLIVAVALAVISLSLILRHRRDRFIPVDISEIDDPAQLDDRHLEIPDLDPTSWIRQYQPENAESGFNLFLYQRRVPMIIDMNGHIVHVWPRIRAIGRARLDSLGNLSVIGTDNLVKEYDWEGNLKWFYQLPHEGDYPHHDFIKLDTGHHLILARDISTHADYLREVDKTGKVVWEWRMSDHQEQFPTWEVDHSDPTHANSVCIIPPNRWHRDGDERFRPGNILVSARNLNTIFILDRLNGKVVWSYAEGMDRQHEAIMLAEDYLGGGLILLFNNGLEDRFAYRRSLVQGIDPVQAKVVWEFGSEYFFSSVGGRAQPLAGGNVLISSSQGGRVFEITPAGTVVWEWTPPFKPMRVARLAYDHCPQLAALQPADETGISHLDRRPYVDHDLYRFEFKHLTDHREIGGREYFVLRTLEACRELQMPAEPSLLVDFGIDENRLQGQQINAFFQLTITAPGQPTETIFQARVASDSERLWRSQTFDIGSFSRQRVDLCISATVSGETPESQQAIAWTIPTIQSLQERKANDRRRQSITEQERKIREQNLQALGYVE